MTYSSLQAYIIIIMITMMTDHIQNRQEAKLSLLQLWSLTSLITTDNHLHCSCMVQTCWSTAELELRKYRICVLRIINLTVYYYNSKWVMCSAYQVIFAVREAISTAIGLLSKVKRIRISLYKVKLRPFQPNCEDLITSITNSVKLNFTVVIEFIYHQMKKNLFHWSNL